MSPLFIVSFVLDHQPHADALQDLGLIICSFLGPASTISLHEACSWNSIKLLDWIWTSSCLRSSEKTRGWSLSNFLRSDELYNHWEFTESMKIAVSGGNLSIVDWLMKHFPTCQVKLEVIEEAAAKGQLEVLKWMVDEHEKGRILQIEWGGRSVEEAARDGHYQVVRWLYEQKLHSHEQTQMAKTVYRALVIGDETFAEFLLPMKNSSFDYSSYRVRPEWILEFSRDSDCSVRAFAALAKVGKLSLMQEIFGLHSPLPEDQTKWIFHWGEALQNACEQGDIPMLQWLLDHPIGQLALTLDDNGTSFALITSAVGNGHVEVLQHLTLRGITVQFNAAFFTMMHAIRKGHLNVFKWMVENDWCASRARAYNLINQAAQYGHIDILEFLNGLDSLKVGNSTQNGPVQMNTSLKYLWAKNMAVNVAAIHGQLGVLQWLQANRPEKWSTNVMNVAAAHGHLEIVKWLHANCTEGCTHEAMDGAAANGHVEIVEWLHDHRTEGLTTNAMDKAAAKGHLKMVRWLHQNTNVGCTSNAMDLAAENGHLDIVKWLTANRSEGCTTKAVVGALNKGHLHTVCWLYRRFPHCIPTTMQLYLDGAQRFEVILYLHEQCPHLLSIEVATSTIQRLLMVSGRKPNCGWIIQWLQVHYHLSVPL